MRTLIGVLFVTIFAYGCASSRAARMVTIGLCATDIGTTAYGLHHGYSETNPIYSKQPIPRAIVLNFAFIWTLDRVTAGMSEDRKRFTWEWMALLRSLPVIWNIYQLGHSNAAPTCTRTTR